MTKRHTVLSTEGDCHFKPIIMLVTGQETVIYSYEQKLDKSYLYGLLKKNHTQPHIAMNENEVMNILFSFYFRFLFFSFFLRQGYNNILP